MLKFRRRMDGGLVVTALQHVMQVQLVIQQGSFQLSAISIQLLKQRSPSSRADC